MRFLVLASSLLLILIPPTGAQADPTPADFVDPLVGTRNMGHTYPGATVPFGGVQLSPDTRRLAMFDAEGNYVREVYRYCAGYQYEDSTITGFSHTHFSGTGHSDLGDVSLMPVRGAVDLADPGGWQAGFSHDREKAGPGYYAVHLEGPDCDAELTATTRTGLHRYTFQDGGRKGMVLDLTANIYDHAEKNVWTFLRVENDTLITGYRTTSGWARTRTVYFALAFDNPVREYRITRLDKTPYNGFYRRFDQENNFPEGAGRQVRAAFYFDLPESGVLQAKVGLSGVSCAGAVANLEAEAPGWDFAGARRAAHQAWNTELEKIQAELMNSDQASVFYTALYHSMLSPVVYEDVDGSYRGLDQNIHRSDGFTNHTIFSLWDTYRALHPLFNLIQSGRNADMMASMLAHQEQSVHGMLPIWSHHANENWCMIGYHGASVIADAVAKGIDPAGGYTPAEALEACVATARVPYFDGVGEMVELGYVPDEASGSSASITLELAYDDWCIAELARRLGDGEVAGEFGRRARNFENIFDERIGFMRPRDRRGRWREGFDVMATHGQGFIEGNAWNYSLYVPHDVPRLVGLMGGAAAFSDHLDSLFTMQIDDAHIAHTEDITRDGIIGNYVHGNEPGHHIPYLYNWAGRPDRTQERVRMIMETMYGTGPSGLCGNDDAGQMSAWYLFSALGFYPVCPGSTHYALGSPLVREARVRLAGDKVLRVTAHDQAPDHVYVKRVLLNGRPLAEHFLDHADLARGGHLEFFMSDRPAP